MLLFLSVIQDDNMCSTLEKIYKLYKEDMFYTAYNILKDYHEAENVVQSSIIKISEYIDQDVDVESYKTRAFVKIVVKNMAFNIYNRRKNFKNVNYDDLKDVFCKKETSEPEIRVLNLDRAEHIAKKLEQIKSEYADILALKYSYEYNYEEIAQILNITEGNARTRLSRAKSVLRDIIRGDKYES